MHRPRRIVIALFGMFVFGSGAVARAVDQPVAGGSLTLKRSANGSERLLFVSKDTLVPFPAVGGPDDPTTNGVMVELFSPDLPTATFQLAPGVGTPGWTVKSGSRGSYRYVDKLADIGSPFTLVQLRQGKLLKIMGRTSGFPLRPPTGPVGIRVTIGSLRTCALFTASTITKDQLNAYSAAKASAASLADCSDASLGAYDPAACEHQTDYYVCGGTCPAGSVCATRNLATCSCIDSAQPCGSTAPVCNGECPVGEECVGIGGFILPNCGCLPTGSTPCRQHQCGGDCPAGLECNYFARHLSSLSGCLCGGPGACGAGGDDCPSGMHCATGPPGTFCVP